MGPLVLVPLAVQAGKQVPVLPRWPEGKKTLNACLKSPGCQLSWSLHGTVCSSWG